MINAKSLRDENNLVSKNLNKENQEIYTDVVCYLRVSNLSDIEQEEVIGDILIMFFDWEEQGKVVKDMIGEDYKQYVDDIIAAVSPQKSILQKIKEWVSIIIEAFCYLLTIDFIFLYLPKIIKGNSSLAYDISLSMAVRGLLIFITAVFLIIYICKNSFRLSKKQIPKSVRFIIGGTVGLFIVLFVYLSKVSSYITLFSIDIRYIIAIITVFWLCKVIRRFLIKKRSK